VYFFARRIISTAISALESLRFSKNSTSVYAPNPVLPFFKVDEEVYIGT
jgi:hypothetical protein